MSNDLRAKLIALSFLAMTAPATSGADFKCYKCEITGDYTNCSAKCVDGHEMLRCEPNGCGCWSYGAGCC